MFNNESFLVLLAAILNFLMTVIWYSVLKDKWMKALSLKESDLNAKDPKPLLITFIGSLWASYGMYLILKHIQPKNLEELLAVAIGTWLFIYVGMGAKHYAMAKRKFSAFSINYGIDLLGFVLMALIIWG